MQNELQRHRYWTKNTQKWQRKSEQRHQSKLRAQGRSDALLDFLVSNFDAGGGAVRKAPRLTSRGNETDSAWIGPRKKEILKLKRYPFAL